ncbi:lipid phosphate phosphatase 1 [Fistulina hepatica ATCC 64428]|uniref:Lipid phosphate phosphatase 1 n=1 Tax=Fistulina hepatica ATCC 64428 TaxID=1128425 RepID=A0A0D7AF62_9AGAR|nr:lipid phosphate phosphatase 1 [Fistulina hepatica ATCC 64428]
MKRFRDFFMYEGEWYSRAYVADWLVVCTMWILGWIINFLPVYERGFSIHDPSISLPKKHNQIGGWVNFILATIIPLFFILALGTYRKSLIDIHHGSIALLATRGLAALVTVCLKHSVGRLRPDFLARCKWDKNLEECIGKADSILEGRKSFPSGHASTAFAGMTFLALFLAGQMSAWRFDAPVKPGAVRSSRMVRLSLTFFPLAFATYVAITRLEDHRHHEEDIIVGSLIGILSACIFYILYWTSPFDLRDTTQPRLLYTNRGDVQLTRNTEFELTSQDVESV